MGIRCGSKEYSIVILDGRPESPVIIQKQQAVCPTGCTTGKRIKWFSQEFEDLFKKYSIGCVGLKATEGMARRGAPYGERIENEAAIFLAAENKGIRDISRKVKATMAKDHGFKGRPKYLELLNFSVFPNFDAEKDNMKEAIVVAWGMMKNT